MILLNNDISSIVVGIEMGRLVFDNLKKVVLYLMPVSSPGGVRRRNRVNVCTGWNVLRVHDRVR